MKIAQILIIKKVPPVNSEVLVDLKNIESLALSLTCHILYRYITPLVKVPSFPDIINHSANPSNHSLEAYSAVLMSGFPKTIIISL